MERLTRQRAENPMEVKGREVRQPRESFKRQRLGEVLANVVDDPVDAAQVDLGRFLRPELTLILPSIVTRRRPLFWVGL